MESKRAEGMSINVIIIAIIALIVLLVVVLIFSGKMNSLIPGLSQETCQARGGDCYTKTEICPNEGMKALGMGCPGTDDEKKAAKDYCCYPNPGK
jgi:hypothetical protein